ncbi:uncharacterized protein E0L32_006041 [Thyridium curvatum]|uniref:Polyketide synthase n=1 Tax=Thyridium curvatum TaxID=1093900 RepID=A0A507BAF7_9PEZI|nr:uncharacterized protein E0L32_006041 [Thyridium curvatum]TPX13570.1 hypothetical protein E0L32_006041 [Thyridium curvatum]
MGSQGFEGPYGREPIAIIGSSCRLPGGASSPSRLWDLLLEPKDLVQEVPSSRFNIKAFYHPDSQHHGSSNVQHAYLIDHDPRVFDRDFFAMNPKEAESLDPQQRMLLETVYEGLESAGYSIQQLRGSPTAVFVGVMLVDMQFISSRGLDTLPQYDITGTARSILANRVSYFYDWNGPSVAVDTGCSSSLVALDQAVQTLRNGDSTMAVAAGTNLILDPYPFIAATSLNMLSPNGRSCMWDIRADGYTRGDGFSVVVLKTLSQAIADNDHIECIVRETGVNQDGRTPGITMPSATAQASLIRSTYAKCGLDVSRKCDRPQFFECHGTGTPTGDPLEAEAIQSVFFPGNKRQGNDELLVGSIKTIVGHTEGSAGLAGVIKASLAVQHGKIPANLHFEELNPKIQPFYGHLRVPTTTLPWPDLPEGAPRRVSVNSFGFGGTNSHAIIESWDGPGSKHYTSSKSIGGGLFVLSAGSGQSLSKTALVLAEYLRQHPETDLSALALTLFRRGSFPFRAAFSATTVTQLIDKLERSAEELSTSSRIPMLPDSLPPRILGVFTGQGAQWATMGKGLYEASDIFRHSLDQMQSSLDSLPKADRPGWSLVEELLAPKDTSRLGTAAISQPLCTALQVSLVNVLHAAGIEFAAVVGHSSGEIGAAYAAGYLDSKDAIRIAYYRGVYSSLAKSSNGQRGKMMAVGMSLEEATIFCSEFKGRLAVAASNSATSCTLAGDAEIVEEAQLRLQGSTFARVLAVDTAYHSNHMVPCAIPYLEAMRRCGVKVQKGPRRCQWYSSVWGFDGVARSFEDDHVLLTDQYWVDNMTKPVFFNQAIHRAVSEEHCFDIAFEVGPHPALKGPASETIDALAGTSLPYTGVLNRGKSAVETFADALGLVWKLFPSACPIVRFEDLNKAYFSDLPKRPVVLKGLPTYSWDHDNILWKEPRASRVLRTRVDPRHELLGHAINHGEGDTREVHWRQVLKVNELAWLRGHRIQGEVLVPASAFLSMAYEAAVRLADDQHTIQLIELHDIDFVRALRLEEDSTGVEVLFTAGVIGRTKGYLELQIACYSSSVDAQGQFDNSKAGVSSHFRARARLFLGDAREHTLPARVAPLLPMDALDMEQFYSGLSEIGFNYSGHFQASKIVRRLDQAEVTVAVPPDNSKLRACMHPSRVDTAFQGLFAGFSFPGDGRLYTTYLPTHIDCVRISMQPSESQSPYFHADCLVTWGDATSLIGNVDLFDPRDSHTEVQMRGVRLTAVGQHKDRWLYATETWIRDAASGIEPGDRAKLSEEDTSLGEILMRTAYCYYRQLRREVNRLELDQLGKYQHHMMTWILDHLFPQIESGNHPDIRPGCGWENDTMDILYEMGSKYLAVGNIDMQLLHAVGQKLPDIVRGTIPPLQILMRDGMVERLYVEGLGVEAVNRDIGALAKQIACRYPRMRILEVGAGTGGATRSILHTIGDHYASYTYTDISVGFFEKARDLFKDSTKATFKTLNIENDPAAQGFVNGAYDMVVASNVLHATHKLEETLQHCRQLLRPGGYLLLVEITSDNLPMQLYMSILPGWFLGIEDGRVWAPTVGVDRWDSLLKSTGFSGVETVSTPSFCSVIMSRATDDNVRILQEPLKVASSQLPNIGEVLIVGDGNSDLACKTRDLLRATISSPIAIHPNLEGIRISTTTAVLCLCDLSSPIFADMSEARFKSLQGVIQNADIVLWVTHGSTSGKKPEAAITVGLGRTALVERSDLRLQFLDVDDPNSVDPSLLATLFLRLSCIGQSRWDNVQWTHEPELALQNGALYFPRVLSLESVNRRTAARNRQVSQVAEVGTSGTAVALSKHGAIEIDSVPLGKIEVAKIRVCVTASSFHPLTDDGNVATYLCMGRDVRSKDKVLALADDNKSLVDVFQADVVHSWAATGDIDADETDASQLSYLLGRALAMHILRDSAAPLWIHGAPNDLAQSIDLVAQEQRLAVLQTTSEDDDTSGRTFIHPYASNPTLQSLIPKGLRTFITFKHPINDDLNESIVRILSRTTAIKKLKVPSLLELNREDQVQHFKQCFQKEQLISTADAQIFPIDSVPSTEATSTVLPTAVVSWTGPKAITALARPLQHQGLLSADKTYILFGMGGDMGISVCKWMVENGAQNVVLVSRTPKVPPGVIEYMAQRGAHVRVMAVDITNREVLRAACADVQATMPPVGGVINGAMVLRDRMFVNMSLADFSAVLAPKLRGTQHLDEIFGEMEYPDLEFFIALSSTMTVVGNIGQSAYNAANLSMTSLIRQRRRRGLAGSVVVLAVMSGFGYVFRANADQVSTLQETGFARAVRESETELHEMLAEAIVCGRPDSGQPPELITGLETTFEVPRRRDLRLACYFAEQDNSNSQQTGAKTHESKSTNVETRLAEAKEPSECLAVLEQSFCETLGKVLDIDPEHMDRSMPVANLGIDSLVAVRIREWFLDQIGVDVSVLKILSTSYSLSRLCEDVLVDWRKLRKEPEMETKTNGLSSNGETHMDWERELARLQDEVQGLVPQDIDSRVTPRQSGGLRIVLTGATGFIGTNLLRCLIADPRVEEVHCLAIRSRPVKVQNAKVYQYQGDLGKALLGLSMDDFARFSQTADIIIHLGADVNLLKSYDALRDANLGSTQFLLAMATPRRIPVHYISSSAVALLQKDSAELAETSVSVFSPPPDAESQLRTGFGYATCKWMAEMLLERGSGDVPATVHRFVNIMGTEAPEEHYLVALDRYCTRMRAVPLLDPERWQGQLDIMDIDELTPAFASTVLEQIERPFAIHNYCSGGKYGMADLEEMYREKLGSDVEVWPLNKWLRKATEMGMSRGVESSFLDTGYVVRAPSLLPGKS